MKTTEAIRLARNIKWKSIDKDNMEFAAERVSCFQKDAIEHLAKTVEDLQGRLRMIISHASGGHLREPEDIERSINDICVEISRHHNRIWEHAQEVATRSSADVQGG